MDTLMHTETQLPLGYGCIVILSYEYDKLYTVYWEISQVVGSIGTSAAEYTDIIIVKYGMVLVFSFWMECVLTIEWF